jgi:hypothetical protein
MSVFRSETTQQTCVCNSTPQSEGNRYIHSTSTHLPHVQNDEEVLHAVHAISSPSTCWVHMKQASVRVQFGIQCMRRAIVSFSCTTYTRAIVREQ